MDPIPPRGTAERVYATIRARFGYWPEDFMRIVEKCYRGRIPERITYLVARLERERPWSWCSHGVDLEMDHCLDCIA